MKIALVVGRANVHEGVPFYVSALATALAYNHEVTIFSASFEGLEKGDIRHRRVWTIGRSGIVFLVTFIIGVTLLLWWARFIQRANFDVIHSHFIWVPFFAQVITSHYCEREAILAMERWGKKSLRPSLYKKIHQNVWALIEKRQFRKSGRKPIIAVSHSLKADLIRHYGSEEGPIHVVLGGVDPLKHSRNEISSIRSHIRVQHGLTDDDLLLLLLGGDWERKGVAPAIEVLSKLTNSKTSLIVVGSGDQANYSALAESFGLSGRVIFPGPQREVWRYYAAGDIFILPTLYESFGLSILEAMAAGLPVVVSSAAGAAELIKDGVNGLLLEDPTDVCELATKLEPLLADASLRRRLGEEAQATAGQYSWSLVAKQTVDIYKDLLVTGAAGESDRLQMK